jgi:type-F conjugative transfer system secretin TraK
MKNKKTFIKTLLIIFSVTLTVSNISMAKQVREVEGNDELLFKISDKNPTRISVENDKIQSLQFKAGILDVIKNEKLGEAYITPKNPKKSVSLFVSTKKGFVYQLLLSPSDIPSAQIILQNKNTHISSGVSKGISNDYERRLSDIIISMQKSVPIENCMISRAKKRVKSPIKKIKLKVEMRYLCQNFTGYRIKIKNKSSVSFVEKDFVTPRTSAIKISNGYLFIINKGDE